jgi:alkylhydroperoxidase family enzyme
MNMPPSGVTPLDLAELPADLREHLGPRVRRLGYLGDFFRYCGHQPAALLNFDRYTEALKKALPAGLTETVSLTVATAAGNDYERVQHERLSRTLGMSDAWIEAMTSGEANPDGLTDEQADARALALAMHARDWDLAQSRLAALSARAGQEQAVGVLMLVGRYLAHAAISNTLHLGVPPVVKPDSTAQLTS